MVMIVVLDGSLFKPGASSSFFLRRVESPSLILINGDYTDNERDERDDEG